MRRATAAGRESTGSGPRRRRLYRHAAFRRVRNDLYYRFGRTYTGVAVSPTAVAALPPQETHAFGKRIENDLRHPMI